MSSLFGSISIALRALMAQQGALQTTSNNIANVNTPGYSRRRADLTEAPPVLFGSMLLGTGVDLARITGIRDRILELRLYQEKQQQGNLDAFLGAMHQVETLFNEAAGNGLQDALGSFFNSLLQLSADPSNPALRQAVLTAGQNLAGGFRQGAANLITLQRNIDLGVTQSVNQINQLTSQIAALNAMVSGREGAGQDANAFRDRRDLLIQQLSTLMDVAAIDAGKGSLTLTTTRGAALVVAEKSFALSTRIDPVTGFQRIFAQGTDITSTLTAGALGGQLQVRDREIPSVLADLDTLAASLANAFNVQHRAGFDIFGQPGGDFFTPPPAGGQGAAASLTVLVTHPNQLAVSSDGTPGDNGNVLALAALRDQTLAGGQRPTDFYSALIFRIGNSVATATAEQDAEGLILQQLENQRGAVSAVSLDEEAANLIRFQRAYEAAARVVSVIDELTMTAINLGRE
jgi:flagellar hook-associated protein 1 FlgK